MRLSKQLIWVNVSAVVVNILLWFLAIVRVCSVILPAILFVGCLIGLILLSAKANGKTLYPKQRPSLHSTSVETAREIRL